MGNFTGTENVDFITGSISDDVINRLAGNDVLKGLGGGDTILGGSGNGSIDGESLWKKFLFFLCPNLHKGRTQMKTQIQPSIHPSVQAMARVLLIVAVGSLALPPTASAIDEFATGGLRESCFSYPSVAMTPYDKTIDQQLFRKTHERVYHSDGKTGMILLYGPVHPWIHSYGDGVNFTTTFRDPDGPGTAAQVVAELRHIGPGGIKTIARLDSNDEAIASDDAQTMTTGVTWSELGRDEGYYVVRVYIKRTDASLRPASFGYNLCSAIW